MSRIILFNKPYGVLSQFTAADGHPGLAHHLDAPGFHVAGRLDADSEGLLILTDDGALQHRLAHPRFKLAKTYWVQVEGQPDEAALSLLRRGVDLGDFVSRPAEVRRIDAPAALWPRDPPIRFRQAIPTAWLELQIREGKNRQVRRMTAKVGYPTLRLVRSAIGPWQLEGLAPGQWRQIEVNSESVSPNVGRAAGPRRGPGSGSVPPSPRAGRPPRRG